MLLNDNEDIQALLDTVSSPACQYRAHYTDVDPSDFSAVDGGAVSGSFSTTAATSLLGSPGASEFRKLITLTVYNADNIAHILTLQAGATGSYETIWTGTIDVDEKLFYSEARGWILYTSTGVEKTDAVATLGGTVVTETAFGQADTAGISTSASRADHTHGTPADPIPAHVGASDPHTGYALLAGRVGGQALIGGTAASNNLTLASTSNVTKGDVQVVAGSDLDILSGTLQIGSTVMIEADRDVAVDLIPNADDALDLGSASRRWRDLYLGPASLRVLASAGDANPTTRIGSGILEFGVGGGTAIDVALSRTGANTLSLADGDTYSLRTALQLRQTGGNYTFTWADPAANRAISIIDPGGTDVFVWRDAAQTLTNKTFTGISITSGSVTGITDLAVADGGTGASSAAGARTNLLPSFAGNAGKSLVVNIGETDAEWTTVSGGSGDRLTYIFQPGGTPDTPAGLYDDFDDLYTAASLVATENNLVTIILDDSVTSPVVIPDDTYDLLYIKLVGIAAYQNDTIFPTAVETGDTVFTNWFRGASWIWLTHTGTAPLATYPAGASHQVYTGTRSIFSAETDPVWFYEDLGGGERDLLLFTGPWTTFDGTAGVPVLVCEDPNQVFINTMGEFTLGADTLGGDGDINISRAAINGDFDLTQPGHSGTVTISVYDPSYTPADAGDWLTPPTLMSAALDELADRVAGMVGGSGDVVGPASATDSAIAVFDTGTGKLLKNSVLIVTGGAVTGMTTLNTHTIPGGTGTLALTSDITGLTHGQVLSRVFIGG